MKKSKANLGQKSEFMRNLEENNITAEFDKSKVISLGHSPDPDDAFMFHAMAKKLIDLRGYKFEHVLQDIQTLNQRCLRRELDISAVSYHAYAYLADAYELLDCGSSMGDGYGPILVAQKKFAKRLFGEAFEQICNSSDYEKLATQLLKGKLIVPGKLTSAFLALQIFLSEYAGYDARMLKDEVEVVDFDKIFNALEGMEKGIGLIIHEGQLTFKQEGFIKILDLGNWWQDISGGLPLPLGGNVISRALPVSNRREIAEILATSVDYALAPKNFKKAAEAARAYGRGLNTDLNEKFVSMYVNDYTVSLGAKGKKAVELFYQMAAKNRALAEVPQIF